MIGGPSRATVRAAVAAAREALQTLARLAYEPTLLQKKGKPKAAKKRKKISGGCG